MKASGLQDKELYMCTFGNDRGYNPVEIRYAHTYVEKWTEKKKLLAEKNNTGIFNPVKHIQLSKQITTLTEDIEELKSRKNQMMNEVGCHNDTEIK